MRLTSKEISAIIETAKTIFGVDCVLKLFGSRVSDDKRGGDIDLLVLVPENHLLQVRQLKFQFIDRLQGIIGEQRIDLVITTQDHAEQDEFLRSLDCRDL